MDEDLFDDADSLGPIFTATFESEDACCGDGIVPGEKIRADGAGGWIHAVAGCEGLAPERPGAVIVTVACTSCFLVHAPGQKECDR